MKNLPPLSLYIHIPWCVRKCPYCDFNSHQAEKIPEEAYINALLDDLKTDLPFVQGRTVSTIFFGGGTPSLLSAAGLKRLLASVQQLLHVSDTAEITLEANPGTLEQEKFTAYRQAGINRLSIGIQSFQAKQLVALGRIHNANEAIQAARMAHLAGFKGLNIDLMYGLPAQTTAQALADLAQAVALNPTHISWYQLTIEPNTVFYNKPPSLPEDDALWDIQEAGQTYLHEQGYGQYEISAYARRKYECQHNINYWQFGDYLGIGAGAHGKVTQNINEDNVEIIRYQKTRVPADYLDAGKTFLSQLSVIPQDELAMEFFMNGFRLNQGVSKQHFFDRTSNSIVPETLRLVLAQAIEQGLLNENEKQWVPTDLGRQHLNTLLQLFI